MTPVPQGVAVLGGTFDRLHAGHLALLDAAFASALEVRIGLTTGKFLAAHPKPYSGRIRPYRIRRQALARLVRTRYPGRSYSIVPLDDPVGGSMAPGIDTIVVSEETVSGARWVNRRRRHRGLPSLRLLVAPQVLGEDRQPIASRRIRAGVIDRRGRRRKPLRVRVRTNDPSLLPPLREALRMTFPSPLRISMRRVRPPALTASSARAMARAGGGSRDGGTDVSAVLLRTSDGEGLAAVQIAGRLLGVLRLHLPRGPEAVRRLRAWLGPTPKLGPSAPAPRFRPPR